MGGIRNVYSSDFICRRLGLNEFADLVALGDDEFILRLLFKPSFDPELCITIRGSEETGQIELRTCAESIWHCLSDREHGVSLAEKRWPEVLHGDAVVETSAWELFIDVLSNAYPHVLRDSNSMGIDGMSLEGFFDDARGATTFTAWSPSEGLIHELAVAALKLGQAPAFANAIVGRVECVESYLATSLCVKRFDGDPYRLRFYGGLSSTHEEELRAVLESVPKDRAAVIDFTNLRGMGTLLLPTLESFRDSHPAPLAWVAGESSRMYLRAMGLKPEQIFDTVDEAMRAAGNRD